MKKIVIAGALGLAGSLMLPMSAAHADLTCRGTDELSPVVGDGPQAKKDRDGDGWICIESGYRKNGNFYSHFYDDL